MHTSNAPLRRASPDGRHPDAPRARLPAVKSDPLPVTCGIALRAA